MSRRPRLINSTGTFRRVLVGALALGTMLTPIAATDRTVASEAPPNIVVFYMDDVSKHDGRLWSDPALTPVVTDLFVENGISFTNAIGETSLCCPGRASLLTGQHTFNHRVLFNDARLFDSTMHVGKALKDAGYATMWIGKYLNNVDAYSEADWQRDGEGWTYLDAIDAQNGVYTDYRLHTKTGTIRPKAHSTRMVAERAVMHIGQVPAEQPLFAVLSMYNMHGPNKPLPEFKDDPRCSSMPPWKPPNYNEADVSDKPPFIRNLPKLSYKNGFPMVGFCREMLGIEWLVETVVDKLEADGRLDNTLLVFTADNGMAWGQHRVPRANGKGLPYTTPVPLYFSFPARWGDTGRQIDRLVSNIDLAPTFCDLAGDACHLGPYPDGQTGPDGLSMLPLIDEGPPPQWRDAALESAYFSWLSNEQSLTVWTGVRTDSEHALGAWHYVIWSNGFEELYDLTNDPWELENQRGNATLAATKDQLSDELASLSGEGRSDPDRIRPDAMIARKASGVVTGNHVYEDASTPTQAIRYANVPASAVRDAAMQTINRSSDLASFTFKGQSSGSGKVTVTYFLNGTNVTSQVNGASLVVPNVRPGQQVLLYIRLKATDAGAGANRTAVVTVARTDAPAQLDAVKASMSR